MKDLKIKVADTVSAPVVKEEVKTFVEPKTTALPPTPSDRNNIANWSLFPLDGDRISARNNRSGEIFEGTVEDFNKKYIRG